MPKFLNHWLAAREYRKDKHSDLVFYSEDAASFVHLGPVVTELLNRNVALTYLTSDETDPILKNTHSALRSYCIGSGVTRTSVFMSLEARVIVMTMPDLETYHIKRSRISDVKYVYLFHSIVSIHQIYREAAFDHFDSILCVGEHHKKEIRERERNLSLPAKELVEHGYGRLDTLLKDISQSLPVAVEKNLVLIAPSWGESCIIELLGEELIELLLTAEFEVVVRPHPMTMRKSPEKIERIKTRFSHEKFTLETDIRSSETLQRAPVMISDWSGVAFEFALAYAKPVIFIDTPRKANNDTWHLQNCIPVEASYRERLGGLIEPEELDKLPGRIREIVANNEFVQEVPELRKELVYNIGGSGTAAADYLESLF